MQAAATHAHREGLLSAQPPARRLLLARVLCHALGPAARTQACKQQHMAPEAPNHSQHAENAACAPKHCKHATRVAGSPGVGSRQQKILPTCRSNTSHGQCVLSQQQRISLCCGMYRQHTLARALPMANQPQRNPHPGPSATSFAVPAMQPTRAVRGCCVCATLNPG